MSKPIETERRFLLKSLPCGLSGGKDTAFYIHQYYLTDKDDEKTERVRHSCEEDWLTGMMGNKHVYTHTVKERVSDMSATEVEREITSEEFNELRKNAKRMIQKRRLIYKRDGVTWEIDDYDYNGDMLLLAEVELPSEDFDLKIPKWLDDIIIMEVTGMKQFSNSNLADEL